MLYRLCFLGIMPQKKGADHDVIQLHFLFKLVLSFNLCSVLQNIYGTMAKFQCLCNS